MPWMVAYFRLLRDIQAVPACAWHHPGAVPVPAFRPGMRNARKAKNRSRARVCTIPAVRHSRLWRNDGIRWSAWLSGFPGFLSPTEKWCRPERGTHHRRMFYSKPSERPAWMMVLTNPPAHGLMLDRLVPLDDVLACAKLIGGRRRNPTAQDVRSIS